MENSKNPAPAVSRRAFLAAAAALPAASLIEPLRAGAGPNAAPWYSVIHRCCQIKYNESDPAHIDPEAWTDYWASLKVDAVLVNGGGIMAFYPTRVPCHHRSKFLGSRDVLGEMVAAAKKRGMRAIARMDCNLAYQEALEAHPEWFERNRDGSARPHTECPWLYLTCMFSTYFSEQMPPFVGRSTTTIPSTASLPDLPEVCSICYKVFYLVPADEALRLGSLQTDDFGSLLSRR
jgi:hypothetical protein